MTTNSIAIFGAGSWAAQYIVSALRSSGCPIRIIVRKGAPLPSTIEGMDIREVSWEDEEAVVNALSGIDIAISLVGHYGIDQQYLLVPSLLKAGVKLFVPSELSFPVSATDNATIDRQRNKAELEVRLAEAGVPFTRIYVGDFAEFALDTPAIGVDLPNNRIVYTGDSEIHKLNLVTRQYVGAAYVSLFTTTLPSTLAGRSILLSELTPTGAEIASAMEIKYGKPPTSARIPLAAMNERITSGSPIALAALVRRMWGEGSHGSWDGCELYDVPNVTKLDIHDLVVDNRLGSYRPLSFDKATFLDPEFSR